MPSIPQSLLWISLVVLWLFVLVPMLISRRDAVRRTSDVALATRVLTSGAAARLVKRGAPAAGHPNDPDWQPAEDEYEDLDDDVDNEDVPPARSVVMQATAVADNELGYLDVDVIDEHSGALPVGASAKMASPELPAVEEGEEGEEGIVAQADSDSAAPEPAGEVESDQDEADEEVGEEADQYEYVDDTSGLEAIDASLPTVTPGASRRRRYDSKTAAAVSTRKYKFRRRVLMTMALVLLASATVAFTMAPIAWWVCGSAAAVTVVYLAYLRRQTRIEARLLSRRMHRMARSRLGVENTHDGEFDVVPSRLRRPGAVVLEIDDEDPSFEHLDYAPYARRYDLPRAAGQ